MYRIIVCSAGRPEILRKQTLAMLARGRTVAAIHIIVPFSQEERYREATVGYPCSLHATEKGLTKQRQFARSLFPTDSRLLFVDDDVQRLRELRDGLLHDVIDLDAMVGRCFDDAGDAHLWGVYPISNRSWQSEKVDKDTAYCVGAFYGIVNDIPAEPEFDEGEDWSRQLAVLEAGGHTLRFCKWGIQTQYWKGDTGGIQRTPESTVSIYNALAERYSSRVTLTTKRNGKINLKFKKQLLSRQSLLFQPAPSSPEVGSE
jgi:hypothetical protein